MEKDEKAAGASSASDLFTHAYAGWNDAIDAYQVAKAAVEEAQRRQTVAIGALPEGERADMAGLETIADEIGIADSGTVLADRLNELHAAFDEMMRIPAPSAFALHLKLEAVRHVAWTSPSEEAGYWLDRLIADAGTVSLQPAHAWIDRWRALGGSFGVMRGKDQPPTATRGMLVALEYWKPKDREHPLLKPHQWLVEREHHSGAVKVLDGLLTLIPGLEEAVYALVEQTLPGLREG